MAEYQFREIEKKWQKYWKDHQTFKTAEDQSRPKFYSLDMFPYPSGAGLHVGHPLGYIASDIISRYKRLQGFNVLHPMGFDAFGLPAEQYAIQTGQHPAVTTEQNIQQYKKQLKNIGFSFDWSREVQTSDPNYYKWTQWIFGLLYNHWYNLSEQKAKPVSELKSHFEENGNSGINAACDENTPLFSPEEWKTFSEKEKSDILLKYRLTYLSEATVNWCPALGTVLSNDEVKDGFSERGGYPVERKKMKQWSQRITAYAERLLSGLETIEWPEPVKEMQRNWIGKSIGAEIEFELEHSDKHIKVFTTRIDTIFGVSFMVLAPEHELIEEITTNEQQKKVEQYVQVATNRSERDRMADTKRITGVFTGAYAIHPFSKEKIPVWIADYVLAGYGTGAVMAVPCGDQRDYEFAQHFNLPIPVIIEGIDVSEQANPTKEGTIVNSEFLNGLSCQQAIERAIEKVEQLGIGKAKVNFKMRDAIFSRQRYWGEPVPVYFKNDVPILLKEEELPLVLPEVDEYKPTEDGDPPLGRAKNWKYQDKYPYELTTMPGWAGSSWYLFRYMDPHNDKEFCNHESQKYWQNVDLYIGGSEHATGHLLYARFWTKFLFDIGKVSVDEPFQKLINQGMIQGVSNRIIKLINFWGLKNSLEFKETKEIKIRYKDLFIELNLPNPTKDIYVSKEAFDDLIRLKNEGNDDIPLASIKSFQKLTQEEVERLEIITFQRLFIDVRSVDQGLEALNIPKFIESEFPFKPDPSSIFLCQNGYYQNNTWYPYESCEEKGQFIVDQFVEKMSKSKHNVVNPDDIVEDYGADTLRLYEMFLGPLEQSKPWNTNGIDGVHRFLKKFWGLFFDEKGQFSLSDEEPTTEAKKVVHRTIKKVKEDIERYAFNTPVSEFMICTNRLRELNCRNRELLEKLVILLSPYAPHISEELWAYLGHEESVSTAAFPAYNERFIVDDSYEYPVSINGKMRTKMNFPLDTPKEDIEKQVLENEVVMKWTEGRPPKKVIVVPKKIVNVVV